MLKLITRTTGIAFLLCAALLVALTAFATSGRAAINSHLLSTNTIDGSTASTATSTAPRTTLLPAASTTTTTPPSSTFTPIPTLTPPVTPDCPSLWTIVDSPNVGFGGSFLLGVASVAQNDVWAVGYYTDSMAVEQTLIEHWDGMRWATVLSPNIGGTNNRLNGIAALSSADIWAVGYYTTTAQVEPSILILHWDGSRWGQVPIGVSGSLNAVTMLASGDVWAVGSTTFQDSGSRPQTLTTHWDGIQWNTIPSPNPDPNFDLLYGVQAVSFNTNDVWAVGYAGFQSLTLHWNGQGWGIVPTPLPSYFGDVLWGIDTISSNDVWAVGLCCHDPQDPIAFHWDGASWNDVIAPNPYSNFGTFNAVTAVASSDVWAVGFTNPGGTLIEHWNGTSWVVVPSPPNPRYTVLNAVDARPGVDDDIWAVGYDGYGPGVPKRSAVLHYEGTTGACLSPTPTPTACPIEFLDVPSGSTFYPYVRCLACRGVLGGYPDETFRPNDNLTRGQAAKIVSNAAGYSDDIPPTQQTFTDVPPLSTFWLYVERAYLHGVFAGYPCGGQGEPCDPQQRPYYRPGNNLGRGQLAKVATNGAGYIDQISPEQASFTDVPPDDPFWIYVERAVAHSIISGYPCGGAGEPCDEYNRPYYRPAANVSRGQTAKIVSSTFFPDYQTP